MMFNDNGIFEYILQDDIFMGVLGMLECRWHVASQLMNRRPGVPHSEGVVSRILPTVLEVPSSG